MNYKRKYRRTRSRRKRDRWSDKKIEAKHGYFWLGCWPRWWDVIHHRRPHRRANKTALMQLKQGADCEGLNWPLGNHKPHVYYW